MDTLRKLQVEIERLRALCSAVPHAFDLVVQQSLQSTSTPSDHHKPFIMPEGDSSEPVAKNIYQLKHRLERQLPRYLREAAYVRLISALEVFLIDLTREILTQRRDLLGKIGTTAEFEYVRLVSFTSLSDLFSTIINKECRRLQNQGFVEIVKFYQRIVGIKISDIQGGNRLHEMYERRHLLVHRLGKTDEKYRHTYNTQARAISVDDQYLMEAFATVLAFCMELRNRAHGLLAHPEPQRGEPSVTITIEAVPFSKRAQEALSERFSFADLSGERFVRLKDIEFNRTSTHGSIRLVLKGDNEHLKQYLRHLKKLVRKDELQLIETVKDRHELRDHKREKLLSSLSSDLVKRVEALIPQQLPLPTSFYRDAAAQLSLSVGKTREIVQAIIYARKSAPGNQDPKNSGSAG